jgi:hypothetical protein
LTTATFVRDVEGTRREARLTKAELEQVMAALDGAPDGLNDDYAAVEEAAGTLDVAIFTLDADDEPVRYVLHEGAALAIEWALESMMTNGVELSVSLHDLRDVVAAPHLIDG